MPLKLESFNYIKCGKVGVKPRLSVEQQDQWPPQSTPGHLSQLQPAQPQNRYFGSHKPSFDGWCGQKSFELFGVWVVASFAILFPALSNIPLPMLRYGVNVCELQRTVSIFYCDIMNKGNMVTAPCTADQISQSQPADCFARTRPLSPVDQMRFGLNFLTG